MVGPNDRNRHGPALRVNRRANAFAHEALTDLLATRVSAEVLSEGMSGITVGSLVQVKGTGAPFDGGYYVTGVKHQFGGESYGGYSTLLRVRRADLGMFHHPEIDDEVLVAFQAGDLSGPYVIGSLWDCDPSTRARASDDDRRCRLVRWPW